jgi:hypothetical protein
MCLARPAPQGPRISRADARGQCGRALRLERHPQIGRDKGAPGWLTWKDEVERAMGIEPTRPTLPELENRWFRAMANPKCDGRVNFRGMWGHVGIRRRAESRVSTPVAQLAFDQTAFDRSAKILHDQRAVPGEISGQLNRDASRHDVSLFWRRRR